VPTSRGDRWRVESARIVLAADSLGTKDYLCPHGGIR